MLTKRIVFLFFLTLYVEFIGVFTATIGVRERSSLFAFFDEEGEKCRRILYGEPSGRMKDIHFLENTIDGSWVPVLPYV